MKKPDEMRLVAYALAQPVGAPSVEWGPIDGMHHKRRDALLRKWEARGWMVDAGWSSGRWYLSHAGRRALRDLFLCGTGHAPSD
jgi:hypothetical protein